MQGATAMVMTGKLGTGTWVSHCEGPGIRSARFNASFRDNHQALASSLTTLGAGVTR